MNNVVVIYNSSVNDGREFIYVNEADVEALKSILTENDTMRQVSQEEFDNYKKQAEVQKEHRELENGIAKYWREIGEHGLFDGLYNQLYRPPIPTKETIMKGFTQVKGRKHISRKKRKQNKKS